MKITTLLVTTERRTGAFITTLDLCESLRARGHDVTVNPTERTPADVTITHLGDPRSRYVHGPHFLMVHGANVRYRRRLPRYTMAWFPSASLHGWYFHPPKWVVVPPPVDPYAVMAEPGEYVTLSQVTPAKGSDRLKTFAKALPEVPFLAVQASNPRPNRVLDALPNVRVVPRFRNPQEMFAMTKIIVMPLGGLSYGRVAVEASVSGIPTIATGFGGIREAMGDSATYCSVSKPSEWIKAIDRLYNDPEAYKTAMLRAYQRADRIDFASDTQRLCEAVEACV